MCIPNLDEISQSTVDIKLLPVWENRWSWNSISCFNFDLPGMCNHRHVILHQHAILGLNQTIAGGVMTYYRFFKMAAIESESYSRVQCWWLHSFKKVKICVPTKFWWDISIHGSDKTTSGFGKRTAAILEFYFQFRSWPMFSPPHVILLQPAKFPHNQAIHGKVMTSYRFYKMAAIESEIYFRVQV